MRFLENDIQGKTVINLDESWLGTTDFRRMNWAYKGQNNNLAVKNLSPRISMIVALDTRGEVFLSLSQSNTNSMTMGLFFKELATLLD